MDKNFAKLKGFLWGPETVIDLSQQSKSTMQNETARESNQGERVENLQLKISVLLAFERSNSRFGKPNK